MSLVQINALNCLKLNSRSVMQVSIHVSLVIIENIAIITADLHRGTI